jgi:hypothetical protein
MKNIASAFLNFRIVQGIFLLFITGTIASAAADDAARINGVANFLVDRANENYLYMYSRAIKRHPYVQQFMPNTCDKLKTSDLRTLLLSDREEWKNSVENDLLNLQTLLLKTLKSNLDTTLFDIYASLTETLFQAFEGVEVRADGDSCGCNITYPIDRCTCSSSKTRELSLSARLAIMGLFQNTFEYTTIEELSNKFREFRLKDFSDISQISSFSETLKEIRTDRFHSISDSIQKWKNNFTGDTSNLYLVNMMTSFYCRLDSALDHAIIMADTTKSFESRIYNTFYVVDFIGGLLGTGFDFSSKKFSDYRRYALFFAKIADAKDETQVRSILKAVTLPPVSFQSKREYQGFSVCISSYLGLAAGIESGNGSYKKEYTSDTLGEYLFGGLSTPVGIELSKGWPCGWSTGILLSVFDFGPAVNSVLFKDNKNRNTFDWADLLTPGACLTIGVKEYPIAFGAGWYRGKSLHTGKAGEHHIYCFAAFDMPLLYWRL